MVSFFRNLSSVGIARVVLVRLRSDTHILRYANQVVRDCGCSDEWPHRLCDLVKSVASEAAVYTERLKYRCWPFAEPKERHIELRNKSHNQKRVVLVVND